MSKSAGGQLMNPTIFAMRRPITTLMLVVALISGGALAYNRMRVDIFPSLNTPKIYVFLDYIGMSPDQIEGFIVNQLELYFQYVDGIQDIDSRNIQQVALCELSFFPGTDMGQAMAQVVAMSDRAMSWMPKGTLPPMIMRMDAGSVPVGYLVFESEITSLGAMGDLAQNIIRPLVQKFVPGTVAISPFGPNMRSIVINVDPQKLLDYNLTPQEVIDALAKGNTIIPAGNIYVKDSMPVVANNATVVDVKRLGDIPLRMEKNVYLRDVATIQDDTDITYGYALVNGKKSVYLPIIKKDTGSTLTVVADVHKSMQMFRDAVPKDVKVSFEFDESPTVVAAVESVATEGLIGAGLTGLMILLFLRDLRSVIVVVSTIPLSLLGSLCRTLGDGQHDQHHVAGRHGAGDRHPGRHGDGDDRERARADAAHAEDRHGRAARQRPRRCRSCWRCLCILSVFVPAFIMDDPLRSLFMPLTLAVGFAMIASYLLSSTFVPILCVALLKHDGEHGDEKAGLFDRMLRVYGKAVGWFVRLRWVVVPAYLAACALVLWQLGLQVGTELFPQVDSGQFVLRFRPPPGSNFELTRRDGGEVPRGDREGGEAREHRDHDGLRRPGRPQLRHRQHGALHARARRRPVAGRLARGQRDQARRVPRAAPQGPPRAGDPLAGEAAGAGRVVRGGGGAASQAVDLRFRAGRYRDQGHELRLADADRGPRRRHRSEDGPAAREKDRRQR